MPTLNDIMDLRGVLERGLAAGIAAQANLAPYTRQNAAVLQKDTPRIEITIAIGAKTGAKRGFAAERIIRWTHWNFTTSFKVTTRPAGALTQNAGETDAAFQARVEANNNLHAYMVALVRAFADTAAQDSWEDFNNFPNHFIAEALADISSPSALNPEKAMELTTLSFTGVIGVRESAWLAMEPPAPPPVPPIQPGREIDDTDGNPLVDTDGNALVGN